MATVTYIKERRQHLGAMRTVMRYCTRADKTWDEQSQQYLVSGVNCDGNNAILEFETTKAAYHKMDGINFYQYVQSFSPEEPITHQQAHEVAKEFAARAWPDSEVLVATHCDAQHIHSHFIINSVSFETGKKLRQNPNTLNELRQLSDQICQAHDLSVLPQKTKSQKKGVSAREYRTAAKGESWKFRLINTIDECMKYSSTKEEFVSLMESEGYAVRWEQNRKSITYTTPEGMKCRDNKLHEEKYLKEVMEDEFGIRAELATQRSAEILTGIKTDEPVKHGTVARTNHAHRHSVSDAGSDDQAVATGGRDVLGAANDAENAAQSKISYRPDSSAEFSDRDPKSPDGIDLSFRTGWEPERAAYLQMAELASGFRPAGGHQVDRTGAGPDRSGAGDGVRNRNSRQQYQKSLSLMPLQVGLYGMLTAGALLDDEDDEERYRRIQAEQEAKNLGAVIGLAAGAAIVVNDAVKKARQEEPQEELIQEEPQQTMGGL